MQESPKEKKDGTVEEEQKERGYYYDDAHGYEEFDPEDEDSEDSVASEEGGFEDHEPHRHQLRHSEARVSFRSHTRAKD